MHSRHKRQKHRNIFWLILSLAAVIIFAKSPLFTQFTTFLHQFPYFAAFIAGLLFASTFTAIAGGLIILNLVPVLSPFWLIILSSLGAVSFDLGLFFILKDRVHMDLKDVYQELQHLGHFGKILHTKYFAWAIPVIGALTFISPLPDELGIELLNLSHISPFRFFLISYVAHLFGVSTIVAGMNLL